MNQSYLEKIPIRLPRLNDHTDKSQYNRLVSHVDQMHLLTKKLSQAKTDHERAALQRQIDASDHQIDKLVYELYELTDEEIQVVEGNR
jgi:predicted  nucleic acid-binding Zn-ribbon protein